MTGSQPSAPRWPISSSRSKIKSPLIFPPGSLAANRSSTNAMDTERVRRLVLMALSPRASGGRRRHQSFVDQSLITVGLSFGPRGCLSAVMSAKVDKRIHVAGDAFRGQRSRRHDETAVPDAAASLGPRG